MQFTVTTPQLDQKMNGSSDLDQPTRNSTVAQNQSKQYDSIQSTDQDSHA
jgi:hypothetical protein